MNERVKDQEWYKRLRNEHNRRKESGYYAERLGCTCINSGEKRDT